MIVRNLTTRLAALRAQARPISSRCASSFTTSQSLSEGSEIHSPTEPHRQYRTSTGVTSKLEAKTFLEILQGQVETGHLQFDKAQERAAKRLSRLGEALVDYDNSSLFVVRDYPSPPKDSNAETDEQKNAEKKEQKEDETSSKDSTESKEDEAPQPPKLRIPRGLYIHGPVGTGKTMLMDNFYEQAPVKKKARYHFHSFLARVHAKIHALKQDDLERDGRQFSIDTSLAKNPIHRVGLKLSESISLLCLDEFQVTDIADAVILSQLFGVMFQYGTVVVATSNRPTRNLYEGGLNRGYFLPFLDMLEHHCIVHEMKSNVDYRKVLASCLSFFGTEEAMKPIVREVLEEIVHIDTPHSISLDAGFQRSVTVDLAYEPQPGQEDGPYKMGSRGKPLAACRLDFMALCDADLGAQDYRAIARHFDVVILENVVNMDLQGHNRARRFITLIDELYEAKCALVVSTAGKEDPYQRQRLAFKANNPPPTPMELFRTSNDVPVNGGNGGESELVTTLGIDVATHGGTAVGALASVRELGFAFDRASSRIVEMCSRSWWDRVLQPNSDKP